jgi:hypothetical protein
MRIILAETTRELPAGFVKIFVENVSIFLTSATTLVANEWSVIGGA